MSTNSTSFEPGSSPWKVAVGAAAPPPARPVNPVSPYLPSEVETKTAVIFIGLAEPHAFKSNKTADRGLETHMLVRVPQVVRSASLIVLLVCIFSLAMSLLTGFNMIHPFISIITALGAVLFLGMGALLERSERHHAGAASADRNRPTSGY
jgi:hypothetical protein